jgi:LacI family transcriptional regulator
VPHRYKVREIAQQSGLSEATVDRVLNRRPGVRENTRAEVMQAIADLDKQRAQLRLSGRRYLIDVVMQTPQRFSDAFRAAIEAELPAFAPAMVRARFHLWESGSTAQMVEVLGGIRGSHGVVLKAQDEPVVAEAIDRLVTSGVPVVTYTTDVPGSSRCGYVGIDNHGAGVTAAYLMNQFFAGPCDLGCAHHGQPHRVPRRGRARGRLPRGVTRLGAFDRGGHRQRRHRRDKRGAGARGARTAPGRGSRLLRRRW